MVSAKRRGHDRKTGEQWKWIGTASVNALPCPLRRNHRAPICCCGPIFFLGCQSEIFVRMINIEEFLTCEKYQNAGTRGKTDHSKLFGWRICHRFMQAKPRIWLSSPSKVIAVWSWLLRRLCHCCLYTQALAWIFINGAELFSQASHKYITGRCDIGMCQNV